MAIYCGVCACRIGSAMDNYGGFSVNSNFNGWDKIESRAKISDSCFGCNAILQKAVTEAANKIVEKNIKRVTELKQEVENQKEAEKKRLKQEAEFRKAWNERQLKLEDESKKNNKVGTK